MNRPKRAIRRRRPVWVQVLVGALAGLLALTLGIGGFYAWRLWDAASRIERVDTMLPTDDAGRPAVDAAAPGSLNYVLMGSDSRGSGDVGRSDVLMLAHVPPKRDKVYIVSFPRDMWVEVPGRGKAKINAAYAWGGEALTIRTVESLIGVRIDHAAKIDFEGFTGLTTQLGGVTVNNRVASRQHSPETMKVYSWPKGEITIQGEEALIYVRQRYGLPNGDLDRAERQRAVVRAILSKMLSQNVIANPVRFNAVMGEIGHYFTVDSRLTNEVILQTATSMRVTGGSDIVMLQAPISGFGRSPDGQSIDVVNEAQLAEMATAIQQGTMADYATKYADQPFAGR